MPQETFLKPTWKRQEHLIKRKCLQFVGSAAAAGPPHPHLLLPQALSILFPLGLGLLTPRYPLQLLAFQVLLPRLLEEQDAAGKQRSTHSNRGSPPDLVAGRWSRRWGRWSRFWGFRGLSFSGCSGPRPAPEQPGSPGETRQLSMRRHASPSHSFPGTRTCGPGAYLAVTSPLEAPVMSASAFSSV